MGQRQYRYDYDLYGSLDDDFLPKPTLRGAFFANPLKGILLLGGVYFAGAVIGTDRSLKAGRWAGEKSLRAASSAASSAANLASNTLKSTTGNKNVVMTAKQLQKYRR